MFTTSHSTSSCEFLNELWNLAQPTIGIGTSLFVVHVIIGWTILKSLPTTGLFNDRISQGLLLCQVQVLLLNSPWQLT